MTTLSTPRGAGARYHGMERLPRLGFSLVAGVGLLAGGLASFASVSAHTTPSNSALTANSSYVSVTPSRILDTRTTTPLTAGGMLQVPVPATVVPAGAAAVVLNVTAVNPTAAGFLTVLPGGETLPTGSSLVSNLNFAAGAIVPNLVTVRLSATGTVELYNYTGSTNVVVDVEGYYATPVTTSGLYNPISPIRVFGTLPIGTAIGAGATTAVTVAGALAADGVPASASAVVLNVTAAHATASSFLTVFPAGVTMPTASNLNFGAQAPLQAIANRVTVGVGASGQIDVYNLTGTVNVDVDVDGYYSGTGGTGSPFVAITPIRVADTVTANKVGSETAIAAAATETFTLATTDIPANAAGVAMNLTAVPGAAPGYLTSYPTSVAVPVASDVNWTASEYPAVPNFTIADTAGTGIAQNVDVANSYFTTGAPVDVIADVFGYFAPSTAPVTTYALTVTALPPSINVYNTISSSPNDTSTITATVTGPGSTPISGDPLYFTSSCGTFTAPTTHPYATTATGVGNATYLASATPGTCTVMVEEADQGLSASVNIIQQPINYSITLAASPLDLVANGVSNSTVTATVDTPSGAPAVGVTVTFAAVGNPAAITGPPAVAGACETTLQSGPFITGADGTTPLTYTSSTTPGFCTLTATATGVTGVPTATVTLDQTSGTYAASGITVAANPTTINVVNSGTTPDDSTSVTASVAGSAGINTAPGDMVMFSATCATNNPQFAATTSTGITAVETLTAGATSGPCTITAQEADSAMVGTTPITVLPVNDSISLAASPLTLKANGVTTSTITATVLNTLGTSAGANVGVTFSCTVYPASGTCGSVPASTTTLYTNASGQVSFTYVSSSTVGFVTIVGTEHYSLQTGSVTLVQMTI